jgi:hypothetical protein
LISYIISICFGNKKKPVRSRVFIFHQVYQNQNNSKKERLGSIFLKTILKNIAAQEKSEQKKQCLKTILTVFVVKPSNATMFINRLIALKLILPKQTYKVLKTL